MAFTAYLDAVQKIYIAFYQRPADPAGLRYWAQRMDAAGGDQAAMIDAFASSNEAKALYGEINNDTIGTVIDAIYQALYNRAPDKGGKQFYVDAFKAGKYTAGTIALNILNGASNDDAVAIANKLGVANEFTKQVDGRALTDPEFGFGTNFNATYAGDADAVAARTILAGVTSNPASVLDASKVTVEIQDKIADATDPIKGQTGGKTFTLTTNADTATANVFEAPSVVTQVGALIDTLQSTDKLTGTGTNPTLNATLSTATVATPTLNGIETINVMAEGGARTLNLSKATGVKDLSVDSSQQSLTVLGVTSVANVQVKNGDSAADTLVQFADSVVSGTADVAKVALTNNGSPVIASGQVINLRGTSAGGFETLEITANGTNRIAEILSDVGAGLGAAAGATNSVRTIKVDGDGSLRVQNALTSTTTFDASANKGGVNVQLDNAGNITVTGGEGDDTFNLAGNLTNTDKIDGGLGRDTIRVSSATNAGLAVGNQVSGVEILRVDNNAGQSFTFDNDDITSIDTIVHNVVAGAGMTYQDMAVASASDATKGLTILNTGAVTYNLKGVGGLGSTDQGLYTKIGGTNAADAAALQTVGGNVGVDSGALTTNGSALTLDVQAFNGQTATGTGTITAARVTSVTVKGGAAGEVFVVNDTGNIGFAAALGVAGTLAKIDGSGFVGNLSVTGNAGAQLISGGTGNDVLGTGGRGAANTNGDVLTGGAGNDIFVFAAADSTAAIPNAALSTFTAAEKALFTQITDLNLGGNTVATQVDQINLAAINGAFVGATTAVINGGAATALTGANFGAAVTAALANVAGLATPGASLPVGTTAVAGLFTWGGETFLIATRDIGDAAAGYVAGSDVVINITGVSGILNAADFV